MGWTEGVSFNRVIVVVGDLNQWVEVLKGEGEVFNPKCVSQARGLTGVRGREELVTRPALGGGFRSSCRSAEVRRAGGLSLPRGYMLICAASWGLRRSRVGVGVRVLAVNRGKFSANVQSLPAH